LFSLLVDLVSSALRAVATSVGVRTLHIRRPRPVTLPPISYSETRGDEWQPTILWPNGRVAWIFPPRLRAVSCSDPVWLSVKAGEGWRAEGRACADADDEVLASRPSSPTTYCYLLPIQNTRTSPRTCHAELACKESMTTRMLILQGGLRSQHGN
jgi:hypothetical protein